MTRHLTGESLLFELITRITWLALWGRHFEYISRNFIISFRFTEVSSHLSTRDAWTLDEVIALQGHHNERDGVSNHRHIDCLFKRLFRWNSNKTAKLHVTGLCEGYPPVSGGSPHKWQITRQMFPFEDVIRVCMVLYSVPIHCQSQSWPNVAQMSHSTSMCLQSTTMKKSIGIFYQYYRPQCYTLRNAYSWIRINLDDSIYTIRAWIATIRQTMSSMWISHFREKIV